MINSSKLRRVKKANESLKNSLKSCSICPRKCGADRASGKTGYCRAGLNPMVYGYFAHHGEEPPLSGMKGSGTIFFSHCNMKCVYCQNYYFSQLDKGQEISIEKLSGMMLSLEKRGCHNINLVSPTHFVPQILMALEMALAAGLNIPIIYNTSGYERADTIKLLDGIVDIYLPDMRYSDNSEAKCYSGAEDYVAHNRNAVKEMHRQVCDLVMDKDGIAKKGLIIRLLAMPNDAGGIKNSLEFIRSGISKNTYLSIMSQYYPTFKAYDFEGISRRITKNEYKIIVDEVERLGLNNGWTQNTPDEINAPFLGTNIKPNIEVR